MEQIPETQPEESNTIEGTNLADESADPDTAPGTGQKRQTFIVRVWREGPGRLWGQVSDARNEWREPFRSPAELWRLLHRMNED